MRVCRSERKTHRIRTTKRTGQQLVIAYYPSNNPSALPVHVRISVSFDPLRKIICGSESTLMKPMLMLSQPSRCSLRLRIFVILLLDKK